MKLTQNKAKTDFILTSQKYLFKLILTEEKKYVKWAQLEVEQESQTALSSNLQTEQGNNKWKNQKLVQELWKHANIQGII